MEIFIQRNLSIAFDLNRIVCNGKNFPMNPLLLYRHLGQTSILHVEIRQIGGQLGLCLFGLFRQLSLCRKFPGGCAHISLKYAILYLRQPDITVHHIAAFHCSHSSYLISPNHKADLMIQPGIQSQSLKAVLSFRSICGPAGRILDIGRRSI